jgi:hypothetical protein
MISIIVVIIHKGADLIFKLRGTVIILQKNEIFHRSVIPRYLSLSHRMIRLTMGMANPFFFKIVTQGFGNIAGIIIR